MSLDPTAANLSTKSPEPQNASTEPLLQVYARPLTLADVDACVALENSVFPPPERCSREKVELHFRKARYCGHLFLYGWFTPADTVITSEEYVSKFIYRQSVCPELSLGLFSLASPNSPLSIAATATSCHAAGSLAPGFKEVLLAHAVGTKCIDLVVTDNAMALPAEFDPSSERYRDPKLPGWSSSSLSPSLLGHQEAGQTLALHSLGVLPEYQGKGYGKIVLKAYIQRMRDVGAAKRIALIAHDYLIKFYKKFGFIDKGRSEATFGGGDWFDMVGYQHNRTNPRSVAQLIAEISQVLEFSDFSPGEL